MGTTISLSFPVTTADTASALGSGDVDVLATPRLIAWAEAATVALIADALDPSHTTVGTRVDVSHVRASPVGSGISVLATLTQLDGRSLTFEVEAHHHPPIGEAQRVMSGNVSRALVRRDEFNARVSALQV